MYINVEGEFYSGNEEEAREEPKQEEGSSKVGKILPHLSSFVDPRGTRTLVVQRALNTRVKEGDNEEQRENIFYTRRLIQGIPCYVIIDSGNHTNVISTSLVEELGLEMIKHPSPYKLERLSDCGELKVNQQVMVVFEMGKYHNEVLCDVVPIQAGHLLLGRP